MKTADVSNLTPLERFLYWAQEREAIRLRREAGEPKPWTNDEILQRYRFCNVRRMDDRVSKWLLENWYRPNYNHPNALLACALARFINLPDSLGTIGYPTTWDAARIKRLLRKRRDAGQQVFNGAYIICGRGPGESKIDLVVDYYLRPLWKRPLVIYLTSLRRTHAELAQRYGFGSFMAGQVVADLRWAMDGTWRDRRKWAPMGPGSKRGMNRLHGRDVNAPLKQEQFTEGLTALTKVLRQRLPKIARRLEAIDVQNCCCEVDKYTRALLGEGRPKATYPGRE